MIVLDTHTWIWWINSPQLLSENGKKLVKIASERNQVYISAISAWEIYMLEKKGRLKFNTDAAHWIRQCEATPYINFIPVDQEIARVSVQLPEYQHLDPADRIIIATAQVIGVPLLSKDDKMKKYKTANVVW